MKLFFKEWIGIIRRDKIMERSATLAYYGLISLAPTLILLLLLGDIVLGNGIIRTEILFQVGDALGPGFRDFLDSFFESLSGIGSHLTVSFIGLILLMYGTTSLFSYVERSLQHIFRLDEAPVTLGEHLVRVHKKALGYIVLAFIIIFFLFIANVFVSLLFDILHISLQKGFGYAVFQVLSTLITIGAVTFACAYMYRFASRKIISWKASFLGGMSSACIIAFLSLIFSLYIRFSTVLSAYGASFFLVALLLWIHWASIGIFIGAEIAKRCNR